MTLLEVTGFVFGIAGIWLTIRESVWCFPVGLINVIVSLFLFVNQKLYSDALQQGVYIILLSYGWISWVTGTGNSTLRVTSSGTVMNITLLGVAIITATGLGYFFSTHTDAHLPYVDASATALSFVAQFMIARKKIENWLVWMIVNVMYVGIYIYKDLYLYAILFAVYFMLAVVGYKEWKKQS